MIHVKLTQNVGNWLAGTELGFLDLTHADAVLGAGTYVQTYPVTPPTQADLDAASAAALTYNTAHRIVLGGEFDNATATLTPGPGEIVIGSAGGPVKQALDSVIAGATTYNARAWGARGDGITDDTSAINAMFADWYANGGGTVYFPRPPGGKYLILGQLVIPHSGDAVPRQPAGRIVGDGAFASGQNGYAPTGGTILDLRYSGGPKILTQGLGRLEISGLTLADFGSDNAPFLKTTNTSLHLHHFCFWGVAAGKSAVNDAIIGGGTNIDTSPDGDNTPEGSFQGYGTVIESGYFGQIRRGLLGQTYFNSSVFAHNTFWATCGASDGTMAAIHIAPPAASAGAFGNVILGNLVEVTNYVYGTLLDNAQNTSLIGNGYWDPGVGYTQAFIRIASATAKHNLIIPGFAYTGGGIPLVSEDANPTQNTIISGLSGVPSYMEQSFTVSKSNTLSGGTVSTTRGNVKLNEYAADTGSQAGQVLFQSGFYLREDPTKTNRAKTDGKFQALGGLTIPTKAGAPVDTDVVSGVSTGDIVFDSTDNRLYIRTSAGFKPIHVTGLGVGSNASATGPVGTLTAKMQVFDANGTSLGYVPIYSSIT